MRSIRFELLFGLIAGLAIGYFLFNNCNKPKPCPCDTAMEKYKDTSGWGKPEPISIIEGGDIAAAEANRLLNSSNSEELKPKAILVTIHDTLAIDTPALIRDYLSHLYYSNSYPTQFGNITIQDSVFANRITARRVLTDFNIPVINKTVVQEQKRTQLYLGVNAQGTAQDPIGGIGPSLLLKTKSDKIIEAGALLNRQGYLIYQAGVKFKISFRK